MDKQIQEAYEIDYPPQRGMPPYGAPTAFERGWIAAMKHVAKPPTAHECSMCPDCGKCAPCGYCRCNPQCTESDCEKRVHTEWDPYCENHAKETK